ncbi:hypothetical protein FVEG_03203 [Fusarium verticillioides 7600]|uniref:Uncharacterized protein n=1 Tax=Gibberella moniliformis (strain M3125 / FGSC 7600) TaxID=334819 RepID=W7LR44_GIBM7|nr:hypothetical protein FVEG_03203 [Fusarium verticillioides 7600]EWG41001.1 hypothetical protein FVEG_03203 [Fusarium verticillioides 7600]
MFLSYILLKTERSSDQISQESSRDELGEDQAFEVKQFLLNIQVGRIVVNEAHFAKRPKSTLKQMIRIIKHEELCLASAAMLSNSIHDFFGYLGLGYLRLEVLPQDGDPFGKYKDLLSALFMSAKKHLPRVTRIDVLPLF